MLLSACPCAGGDKHAAIQGPILFSRAVLLGELGAEEVVELAAACEADPWLDKDRETLAVQRVHHWFMLDHALTGFWAPDYQVQGVVGKPMNGAPPKL